MKEPKLIKRCRHNHNKLPATEPDADCVICGDCRRAHDKLIDKYEEWLKKKKSKKA